MITFSKCCKRLRTVFCTSKLFTISSIFIILFLLAGVLGYLLPEKWYLTSVDVDKLKPPTLRRYILVRATNTIIENRSPSNYQLKDREAVIRNPDGSMRIFGPNSFSPDEGRYILVVVAENSTLGRRPVKYQPKEGELVVKNPDGTTRIFGPNSFNIDNREYILVTTEIPAVERRPVKYQPKEGEVVVKNPDGTMRIFGPHPFGTDKNGRDMALRLLVGTRTYLIPSFIAVSISIVLGIPLGIISSDLWGRGNRSWIRVFPLGFIDMLEAMPKYITILLAIIIIPAEVRDVQKGIFQWHKFYWLCMILGLLNIPKIGKLIVEKVNALEKREFIESAISMGLSKFTVVVKHVLRYNCVPLFITQAALLVTEVIFIEITLSYLGNVSHVWGHDITVPLGYPSWGNILMMGESKFLAKTGWWMTLFPLAVVVISVSMINLFGYSLTKILTQERASTEI